MMAAWFAAAGSGSQRLRLSEAKQREPMRMRLPRHQLFWTFANALNNPAAKEGAMVKEELQQTQVLAPKLATQREVVA
jgi:hypothetical protein